MLFSQLLSSFLVDRTITSWMVLKASTLGRKEILEICIVLIHPFPPFHNIPFWGNEKWGLFMFLRLHMVVRVLRDFSTVSFFVEVVGSRF